MHAEQNVQPNDQSAAGKTSGAYQTAGGVTDSNAKLEVGLEDKENDPGLLAKIEEAKAKDKKEEEEIEAYLKPYKDVGEFKKILKYNNPMYLIPLACLLSAFAGFT